MVDVPRHSTFPPILGRYNSQAHTKVETIPASRGSATMKSLLDNQHTAGPLGRSYKPQRNRYSQKAAKMIPRRTSLELMNKKLEEEAKRKEYERAENTLKAWDSLKWQENDQRHHLLMQRVKIQRELIEKNDQQANDLRIRAEEERIEKIQSRREARRETANELQAHYQRVEEHKKRILKKLQEIKESQTNPDNPVLNASKSTRLVSAADSLGELSDKSEEVSPRSSEKAQTVVLQLLGIESTRSIDTMWSGMKADALRKISPVIKYSDHLKQVASPSVRQCLEVYEQPAARDRYTGKPIPLTDILGEATVTRGHHLAAMNSALEMLARNTQKKAELMLEKKDTLTNSELCDPKLYLTSVAHLPQPKLKSAPVNTTRSIVAKRYNTSHEMKKQLPSYLTTDGDLVSGSLEELGDQYYCAPSRTRSTRQRDVYSHPDNSVFLTDLQGGSSPQGSACPSSSDLSNTGSRSSLRGGSGRWQPLNTGALIEHIRVTELPVSGIGHLAHGKYSMWKPNTCVVNDSD